MIKYASYFKSFNDLIQLKKTGSLAEMAERFDVSKSTVKTIISTMEIVFNAPIVFSRRYNSYIYERPGILILDFNQDLAKTIRVLQTQVDEYRKNSEDC